ncbi:MAG: hypothetical protein K0B84_05835 [Firmicutes bacterium]|nr:hypothetical protein [Bacillota bacterium]
MLLINSGMVTAVHKQDYFRSNNMIEKCYGFVEDALNILEEKILHDFAGISNLLKKYTFYHLPQ